MRGLISHLRELLTPAERRRWLALGPLLVLTGAIEMVGTGLVFALIKVAGDPSTVWRMGLTARAARALGWSPASGEHPVVLATGCFVAAFFLLRSAALILVTRAQSHAMSQTIAALSGRVFQRFLSAPYAVHLRHTSSELAHDVTYAVERAVESGMGSLAQVSAETLVSAGLVVFLLLAAPGITLATAVVLGAFLGIALRLTKRTSQRWGSEREHRGRQSLKDAQESLAGIREIKILGRETAFTDAFMQTQERLADARGRHGWLIGLPRVAIETIFVASVVVVVAIATLGGRSSQEILPLLGLFAYAGFRLIPSANRILLNVDSVRRAIPAVERLVEHLDEFALPPPGSEADAPLVKGSGARPGSQKVMAFHDALTMERVSFRYAEGAPLVLTDVSITIKRGQSVGVVGPTGAGKSTLIDLVFGLLEPTSGRITVDGADLRDVRRAWQGRIGYVPQTAFLFADSLRRNVALGIAPAEVDERRLHEALELAQLGELVRSLPKGVDTPIGERGIRLSGGQRQRVSIARALYHDPDLLVLDEATAALDNKTERELTEAIERLRGRKTLIVIAHRLTTVERCDALVFLSGGHVKAVAPYRQLLAESAEFRAMATTERREAAAGGEISA
ncbi:MAG TPA: ABC transporter ATP-binding protein [Polyangia bacterium]